MAQIQNKLNNTNKNGGNDKHASGGNKSNKVPFWRQFYFCIHGACNIQGSHCLSKAECHKDNATANKQPVVRITIPDGVVQTVK